MKSKKEILTSNHFELTPRNMKTENEMGFLNIEYTKIVVLHCFKIKILWIFCRRKKMIKLLNFFFGRTPSEILIRKCCFYWSICIIEVWFEVKIPTSNFWPPAQEVNTFLKAMSWLLSSVKSNWAELFHGSILVRSENII